MVPGVLVPSWWTVFLKIDVRISFPLLSCPWSMTGVGGEVVRNFAGGCVGWREVLRTGQCDFHMAEGPACESSDDAVDPVVVVNGAAEGQGDGGHVGPEVIWFRGKGMLDSAFEAAYASNGTTFAAEWVVPGMRNPTRVFAVANRYVAWRVPPPVSVSASHSPPLF